MSENDQKQATTSGIGFCGALTLLFIGLKLTHLIDWSWVWVLAPMWIPLAIALGFLILGFIIYLVTVYVFGKED